MDDLILHHYDGSPFAEKARLMLGYKGMAWQSVKIPRIMPKPDVVALTGGYRRTPILQAGADVWCDTALIARVLEARQPQPTLFPAAAALAPLLAQWADGTLFWTVIPYAMQPAGLATIFQGVPPEEIKAFGADRAPFTSGMKRQSVPEARVNLRRYASAFDAQLAGGQPYLCGDVPSIADFSVAHCLWYVHRAGPEVATLLAPFEALAAWYRRVQAFGHGRPQRLDSGQALAIAAAAREHAPTRVGADMGLSAGQAVTVTPLDYGFDPSAGTLVGLTDDEIVIERRDDRAGTVHVHFPRAGYQVREEKPQ